MFDRNKIVETFNRSNRSLSSLNDNAMQPNKQQSNLLHITHDDSLGTCDMVISKRYDIFGITCIYDERTVRNEIKNKSSVGGVHLHVL